MAPSRFSSIPEDREIHRVVSCAQIEQLRTIFTRNNGRLKREELRKVLAAIGLQYTDEQYRTLFLQINTDHDEYCQWDELLSYMILGFQDDDPLAVMQSLNPPISEEVALKLGRQVYTIARVDFCPMVYYDGSISWSQGHWITTSREGVINYWTKDWKSSFKARSTPSRLKRSKTWLLDAIPLPDQRSFCVASLEFELRFYEVVAGSFVLKVVIEQLPHPISALDYWYERGHPSKLLLGDCEGHVAMLELYPERKVVNSGESFSIVTWVSWKDVIRGRYPPLEGTEYGQLVVDQVRMVRYVENLNSLIVASEENPLTRQSGLNRSLSPLPTMVLQSLENRSTRTAYHVPRGVTCFAFEPITELLVSGGPDCELRLWDIRRPEKPSAILSGHTASIVFLFVQDAGEKIYSLDQKRIVKVWDVRNRVLLQTFTELTAVLGQNLPVCAFYDNRERQLIVANNKLASLSCCPEIPLDRTDGESHTRPISVLLYNSLYKLIISCGLDSVIITWDHCMNRKMSLITEAHTQMRNGLRESVEITAGCLDGKQQLLATGARDGSVKLWNISGRTCMRTFSMQEDCEVTALFWVANRILAMGWNHRVVEFFATVEQEAEYPHGLPWRKLHSDDILCAAVASSTPEALATCSYAGELVLWMLETGQPYRRYNAANPHIRIPISFRSESEMESSELKSESTRRKTTRMSLASRRTMGPMAMDSRRLSRIVMPMALEQMRRLSIQVLMFLRSRPMHPAFGTLLGSLETGVIQVWSHHPDGGYRGQFNAIHMAGDRVIAMTSDTSNRFLFTGTALGYIKTWYIENCWIPDADKFKVNKPSLRIRFPFLLDDVIPGRAKRSARSQPYPWLLNAYQAHRSCITGLVYLESAELLLSSSSDRTVRLWTLAGRYIGLLGSPVHWEPLQADLPPPTTTTGGYRFRIPPDLRREVSFTTAKVLRGAKDYQRQFQHSSIALERSRKCLPAIETYGGPLQEPLLNPAILKLPPMEPVLPTIRLERGFLPSLPVYSHVTQFPLKPIAPGVRAELEQLVKRTGELQFPPQH